MKMHITPEWLWDKIESGKADGDCETGILSNEEFNTWHEFLEAIKQIKQQPWY